MADERVLLDTSALYALISSTDEYHSTAEAVYRDMLEGSTELWVTSYVFVEFGALVRHRLGFAPLDAFVRSTEGVFETLWIDERLHVEAWAGFRDRQGRGLSFVDWTTLLAARRLEATIFSFDGDFRSEGTPVTP